MTHAPRSRRIDLDLLRGYAIVGVVVVHNTFSSASYLPPPLSTALRIGFDGCVLLFFFVAGMLLRPYEAGSLGSDQTMARFWRLLKQQGIRLLIPWLLWGGTYSFLVILACRWLLQSPCPWPAPLSPEYPFFIVAFPLYFLLILFLMRLLFQAVPFPWLAWSLPCLAVAIYANVGWPARSHGNELILFPLYAAAMALGELTKRLEGSHSLIRISWLAIGLASLGLVGAVFYKVLPIFSLACLPLLQRFALVLQDTLSSLASPFRIRILHGWAVLGRASGGIYLLHTPLLMPLINRIIELRMGVGVFTYFFTLCSALLVSFAFTRWLESILPHSFHFLILSNTSSQAPPPGGTSFTVNCH